MRVLTIGGGPAGLYASLLLKKADPSREITVIERNPRGATYGWGVVFSDRTLSEFQEADPRTFEQVTERFVLWDAISVRFRGEVVRSGGHVFAGLARVELLQILARRCEELGVALRFETEADPLTDADADLVIGGDGVHSALRTAHDHAFKPRFDEGRARYIWYGTPLTLDSFTFSFRENEHGFFQAHAYPFDGETSTFIVECAEDVWRRSGLDEASEAESIAYCEGLFAEDLRGRPLLSNNSSWISFVTVRCRTWHQRNIALLGDAAHTAHFSIGSGTKLAMEDAIALARAFERRGDDIPAALAEYESERKPVVERFQEAADESRTYFERTARYRDFEPKRFAFHLLTRSGRIDHDVLRIRDPAYADGVDRWFAGVASGAAPPPLFTPVRVRGLELRNRAVVREVSDGQGAGLVLSPLVAVSPEGRITPEDPSPAEAAALVRATHGVGARFMLRLGHAGPRGATRPREAGLDRPLERGWGLLAASPLQYAPASPVPKQMDRGDMARVLDAFVEAAGRAAKAGVDLLQVHMAHGYLLASFLSPLTNARGDAYGGSPENRLRFPVEVLDAVRATWTGPLSVALTATDWERGGLAPEDAVEVARVLKDHGCDLLEPLAGQTTPRARPRYGPAFLAPYADRLRNEAGVPVLVGGAITTTGRANTLLASGRADLCILD